jgi:hypothetical protein
MSSNLINLEDKIRVILEENARIWHTEPPQNIRSLLDQIHQAYIDEGWHRRSIQMCGIHLRDKGFMTGEGWYVRFRKEYAHLEGLKEGGTLSPRTNALKAAKKVAGISNE